MLFAFWVFLLMTSGACIFAVVAHYFAGPQECPLCWARRQRALAQKKQGRILKRVRRAEAARRDPLSIPIHLDHEFEVNCPGGDA